MNEETPAATAHQRPLSGRLWGWLGLAAIAGLALMVPLYMEDLNQHRVLGTPLGFWLACLGAPSIYAAILLLAFGAASKRKVADGNGDAAADDTGAGWRGLSGAAVWTCTIALFLATAALFELGQDGLAASAGILAGFVLMALLIAPGLANAGAGNTVEFIALRFGAGLARAIAVTIACVASLLLLAGLTRLAAGAAQGLFADLPIAFSGTALLLAILAALLAIAVASRPRVFGTVGGVGLAVVALAIGLAALPENGGAENGWPVPHLALGTAVERIAAVEADLVDRELADPARLKPFMAVFLSLNPIETLALVATLMFGLAVLPHLNAPFRAAAADAGTRKSLGTGFLALALIVSMLPMLVIAIKLGLYRNLVGLPLADLPQWVFDFGRAGLATICGQAAVSVEHIIAACDGLEILPLEEFALHSDAVLPAAPRLLAMSPIFSTMAGLLLLFVALAGMAMMIAQMLRLIGRNTQSQMPMSGYVPIVGAGFSGAWLIEADFIHLAGWAISIAAAGLFPAVALGLIWRRCSSLAAISGMLTGMTAASGYILAVEMAWMTRLPGFDSTVAGALAILPALAAVVILSLLFPADQPSAASGSAG